MQRDATREADTPLRWGAFVFDPEREVLLHDGAEVHLRPKVLALLAHLIERRDRVVAGNELMSAVWPDVRVTEATLASTLRELRRTLGDRDSILTVRGRGYRFAPSVAPALEPPGCGAPREPRGSGFVGRRDVLAVAGELVDQAASGRGGVLLIGGPAGIGKSRALAEICRAAAARGLAVDPGRCLEAEGAPSYWPWIQVLRSARPRGVAAERETELLPILDPSQQKPVERRADDSGAAARFRIMDAVAEELREAARASPRILALDDLHRADEASLGVLQHVLHFLHDVPLLLLGTYRNDEVGADHPLAAVLAALRHEGRRLDMAGLDATEVAELLAHLMGQAPSPGLVDRIHERTAGNPLFVSEIARLLEGADSETARDRAENALPTAVRDVLRERVRRQAEPVRAVLEAVAVLGREFEPETAQRLCHDLSLPGADDALDAACAAELLVRGESEGAPLRFSHILIRDMLVDDLSSGRQAELHRAAGLALEALHPFEEDAPLDELAHHFRKAGDDEARRALEYSQRAGERALSQCAYLPAARHFAAASKALKRVVGGAGGGSPTRDYARRCELLLLEGAALWRGGEPERARIVFADAARAARRCGDAERFARAALGFAGRTDATQGVNRDAVALLEEALGRLPSGDSPLRAEVLSRLGTELYYDADPGHLDEATREAVAMAERLGDGAGLAYALSARHYVASRLDVHPKERLALAERTVRLAELHDSPDTRAVGLQEQMVDLLELGHRTRLDEVLREFTGVAERLAQPFFTWMAKAFHGLQALLDGHLAEAEERALDTFQHGVGFATPNAPLLFAGQIFCIRFEQGRLGELIPVLQQTLDEQPGVTPLRAGLAMAHHASGDPAEARRQLELVMAHDLADVLRDEHWLSVLAMLSTVAAGVGDAPRAEQLYRLLLPCRDRVISVGHATSCLGAVALVLAALAEARNEPEAAGAHYAAATALHRRLGARLWLARGLAAWAHWARKHGTDDDRAQATSWAEEALSIRRTSSG